MRKPLLIPIFIMLMGLVFIGCTYQQHVAHSPPGLPEQIYKISDTNDYKQAKVGVFGFLEPKYAPGVGKAAAESVYYALLQNNVFSNVTNETYLMNDGTPHMLEYARSRGYDLIITGELVYYRDGVSVQRSHVAERIKVIHVPTNETLWDCATVDTVYPVRDTDYIFFIGAAAPPSPAGLLMQRNAQKFCKLLLKESLAS